MRLNGRYFSFTSPPGWCDRDGIPATDEEAAELNKRALGKFKTRLGHKKPGPQRLESGETIGEQRLALLEEGVSMEQIAERHGHDIDVVRRSLSRGRNRKDNSGQ
jgi:hypothetical protein